MMASLKNLRNSDNQGLSKAAQGAYFVIDEGKDRQKGTNYKILACYVYCIKTELILYEFLTSCCVVALSPE